MPQARRRLKNIELEVQRKVLMAVEDLPRERQYAVLAFVVEQIKAYERLGISAGEAEPGQGVIGQKKPEDLV
jgi:hypothetical protein